MTKMNMMSVDNFCEQFGSRSGPIKLSGLIWIETVRHADGIPERFLFGGKYADDKKVCKIIQHAKS